MTATKTSPEYLARQKRLEDALSLKVPDRVPVAPVNLHYYPIQVKGISNRDAIYHWDKRRIDYR
jgi:hypothetical protein